MERVFSSILQRTCSSCLTHLRLSSATNSKNLVSSLIVNKKGIPLAENYIHPSSVLKSGEAQSLSKVLSSSSFNVKPGSSKTFYGISDTYRSITLVGTPDSDYSGPGSRLEDIRKGYASAIRALNGHEEQECTIDVCEELLAASEGCYLSNFKYDQFKTEESSKTKLQFSIPDGNEFRQWIRGRKLAESQNFARKLMETPSNYMTPSIFVKEVSDYLSSLSDSCDMEVAIKERDSKWLQTEKMNAFLGVAKGSVNEPRLLEIHVKHKNLRDSAPLALIGKGVTFDSGGISIKPSAGMGDMRGDMGGAACVAATAAGVISLNVPVNAVFLMGLCENMPSSRALKPGDVLISRSGKSIEVDNTDAEGRLVLADVLDYADTFQPNAVIDIATLTGAMSIALGAGFTGAFSSSTRLTDLLRKCGQKTGDQFWPMPLSQYYVDQIKDSRLADVINTNKKAGRGAGACTAAAFLSQFVKCKRWVHLDIAGVMKNSGDVPYLGDGMSGRPTRSMIEFCKAFFEDKK